MDSGRGETENSFMPGDQPATSHFWHLEAEYQPRRDSPSPNFRRFQATRPFLVRVTEGSLASKHVEFVHFSLREISGPRSINTCTARVSYCFVLFRFVSTIFGPRFLLNCSFTNRAAAGRRPCRFCLVQAAQSTSRVMGAYFMH